MRLHPAYPPNSSSHTVLAMVASAFEANPQAWSLRLVTSRGVQSAWLTKEIIPFQVAPGQVWNFRGEIVDLGEYGEQFEIRDAVPSLPTDLLLIPFLAHHVPGLSQIRAQRMWETLGNGLVESLEHDDISTLSRAHGGPTATKIATLAVRTWIEKVAYTQLVNELYQYRFTERVLYTLIGHYGQRSLAYIQDDPYRLLAFAELGPVDHAALERFGIHMNDHRRLMGIVDADVYALYDDGTVIFLQSQLETAIHQLASPRRQQVVDAINLALQHGRLVAATERHLMGDGFARIERSVIKYLATCNRLPPDASAAASCTNIVDACEVGRVASDAAAARVSIIIAREETAAFKFVQCVTDLFSARDGRCYIVAGSDALCQRIHAATGLQPMALHRAMKNGLVEPDGVPSRRAIAIVSSTIDFLSMSQLLLHLRTTDQLFFVGHPLLHGGDRALLFPALLAIDHIFRRELPSNSFDHSAIDFASRGMPDSSSSRSVYNPRESERRGVFWICVADHAFERAIVGISHQLRRHGSVTIVARDGDERQFYARLIDKALAEASAPIGYGTVSVATADGLESGDSDSSVVVVRHPEACGAAWFHAALGTAANRAVVVSTVELDYQFPIIQDEKPFSNGFVTRWRQVVADQEQQGQYE